MAEAEAGEGSDGERYGHDRAVKAESAAMAVILDTHPDLADVEGTAFDAAAFVVMSELAMCEVTKRFNIPF